MKKANSLIRSILTLAFLQVLVIIFICYNTLVFQVGADEGRSNFRAEVNTWGQVCPRFRAQDME